MTPRCTLPLILACATALGSTFGAERTESASFPVAEGATLSLENVKGDVRVSATETSEVSITWTKSAATAADLDRIAVQIEQASRSLEVEVDYGKGVDGSVTFEILVPRGTIIDEIELVDGNLHLAGLRESVSASVVSGSIQARDLSGDVDFSTVSAELRFEATGDRDGAIQLDSVNGDITLTLPRSFGAKVELSTVHGEIKNEFGVAVEQGRFVGRTASGTIGDGGCNLEVENVNGSIRLLAR